MEDLLVEVTQLQGIDLPILNDTKARVFFSTEPEGMMTLRSKSISFLTTYINFLINHCIHGVLSGPLFEKYSHKYGAPLLEPGCCRVHCRDLHTSSLHDRRDWGCHIAILGGQDDDDESNWIIFGRIRETK